jgi:hypothetical protein
MKTKAPLLLIMLFLGASCDTYNFIYYTMENNTASSIAVKCSFIDNFMDFPTTDTLIFLSSHQSDTLFTFEQISTAVYNPESNEDMTNIRDIIIKRLPDSTLIKKEANSRENWEYYETGKHSALMKFLINDIDFK